MKQYNVEFFDRNLNYIGSQQIGEFTYEFDYLSPSNNSINLIQETQVGINNIVCITAMDSGKQYVGIVTDVKQKRTYNQVQFKPLISIFDINVVRGNVSNIETWIVGKITETFIDNTDAYQNYPMQASSSSSTAGSLDNDAFIVNLYDSMIYALKKYEIAVNIQIDFSSKNIVVTVGKETSREITIEADLPNIIEKNISIKEQELNALNKITIINISEVGNNEEITYYRDKSGNITSDPDERIIPVVFDVITIDVPSEKFDDTSLEEATSKLAVEEYNNLIEITLQEDDSLINPSTMNIGQKVRIISGDKEYHSVFTGLRLSNNTEMMMFGAIREELTKILKRRLRNEYNK